jgi:hypothetical protein
LGGDSPPTVRLYDGDGSHAGAHSALAGAYWAEGNVSNDVAVDFGDERCLQPSCIP